MPPSVIPTSPTGSCRPSTPAATRTSVTAGLLTGGAALTLPSASLAEAVPTTTPADGWTQTSFAYSWRKPWHLDLSDRHAYSGGIHRMWVYATDEPFEEGSCTDPRTEMRWKVDYTTGSRLWDADVHLASGTDGASFVQIPRSARPSETPHRHRAQRLRHGRWHRASLRRHSVKTGAYGTWFNVKIAHQASSGTGSIKVYFDGSLVLTVVGRGPATRSFKNGVYDHGSGRAEARFRNLRYWTR